MIHYIPKGKRFAEYYPKAEADSLNIQYIPWRDATESGQWVLSDDGYVVKVIRVIYITEIQTPGSKPRVRRRIVTELAVRYPHGKAPLKIMDHIRTKNYGLLPRVWWKEYQQRYPTLNRELAELVITHSLRMRQARKYDRKEYMEMVKLSKKIFKNGIFNWYQLRTYFNHEEVRMEIQEEIKNIAKERGYTVKKVFDLLDKAEQYGDAKGDGKVMLAMAKEVAAIVGMSRKLPGSTPPQLPATDAEIPGSDSAFDAILARQPEKTE